VAHWPSPPRQTHERLAAHRFSRTLHAGHVAPGPLEAHVQSLIDWFAAHPQLALAAAFAGALLESLALAGAVVPGSTIVFAAGVLAGLRVVDPWLAGGLAVAGAMLGDTTSYVIGRRYRRVIRDVWPMRRFPGILARAEAYFAANGRKSIFVGRFLGPIRALVPLVAGMSRMHAGHFIGIDALAAVAWAAAHLVPGVLFGASLQLAGAVSSRLVALVAILAVGFWIVTRLIRLVTGRGWPYLKRLGERMYVRASSGSGLVAKGVAHMLDPSRNEPLALLVSATLLVAGAWLFLGVVEDVVTQDRLVDVDRAVYGWLSSLRSRAGDDVMVTISELAGVQVTLAVIAAVALWLAVTRRFLTLAHWLAAAALGQVLVLALKYGLQRARPPTAYVAIDEFSFPSGHAAMTIVVYGFLAFLLGHGKPISRHGAFALAAAAIAALVAFSRLYLGVHWMSDVIAGFGLGIAWIALLGIGYIQHVREPTLRTAPLLAIVVAVLVFVGGPYAARHHARDLERYASLYVRPSMPIDAWQSGGWRELPAARTEIGGGSNERFSVQWVGMHDSVARALTAGDWKAPARWKSSSVLLWLVPSTPIEQLPVVPKWHEGRAAALTFVKARDPRTRDVIRLWHVADATEGPTSWPIYDGMITTEHAHPQWGMLLVARTEPREPSASVALANVVPNLTRTAVEQRANGGEVLLLR